MSELEKKEKPYGFWNWGTGLAIASGVGILGILFVVYLTTTMNTDMVVDDYYGQELIQNKKVASIKNANALSSPIKISETPTAIIVAFPQETINKIDSGSILFYRASDINLDIKSPIALNKEGLMVIDKSKFQKGLYSFQAEWKMNNDLYRSEQNFMIE